ncbi:MAG: hypothetical protein ABR899_05945 [Candidatus Krumholzibacteriaceae bacterium]
MPAVGDGYVRVFESPLTFRLQYVSGGKFFADWLDFTSVTAVESSSWGAIKSLFR